TNVNVLIIGETGTGRELIARELHRRSSRAHAPIIVVNNGIIPDNFLDEEATLFIDEISEISISAQTELFKILQNSRIRVVASTQQPLKPDDLFYRLNFIPISVPALRDRGNDVLVIANYFLHRYAELHHKTISGMSEAAQNAMLNYRWPGNVRQLENRIHRAIIMCEGTRIEVNDLDIETLENAAILPLQAAIDQFRQQYISSALERNAGNRTQTAKELGVDPRTVFRHLEDKRR
ncbi:MAG: sigma-54-dependent Fis family transcriptional regulator, partial [Methylococcaceae bacterium]|nr:sigma-54-dependent Fis family transcriptional regulator [Methylococcaceae bacterium]